VGTFDPGSPAAIIKEQAEYILGCVCSPSGAIGMTPGKAIIWPYNSHFAAVGLFRADRYLGDRRYGQAALAHLEWYHSVMQPPYNIVTDYDGSNNGQTLSVRAGTKKFDSIDSYAALFIWAIYEGYLAGHITQAQLASTWKSRIDKAIVALNYVKRSGLNVTSANGMYNAKHVSGTVNGDSEPYPVVLLMDNCEVYAGLRCAATLYGLAGAPTERNNTIIAYNDLAYTLNVGLWDATTQQYAFACAWSPNYIQEFSNWDIHFIGAQGQLWALAWNLPLDHPEIEQHFALWGNDWDDPDRLVRYHGGPPPGGFNEPRQITNRNGLTGASIPNQTIGTHVQAQSYRPVGSWHMARKGGAYQAGQHGRLSRLVEKAREQNFDWPYNVTIAGSVIIGETGGWTNPAP
jgi:hypothetical protein